MFRRPRNLQSSKKNKLHLSVEALDDRVAPAIIVNPHEPPTEAVSATLNKQGVLTITGTTHDDLIAVGQANGRIYVSGVQGSFNAATVARIEVDGKAGNDIIRLDGAGIAGAVPVAKPAMIHGGAGNDFLIGGSGMDFMFGDAGNDYLIGNAGNDVLYGGAGKDQMYGGLGNDIINADLDDGVLAGQAGNDRVVFDNLDPAPLAAAAPNMVKTAAQTAVNGQSFSVTKNGAKLTIDHLTVTNVDITDGVTTLTIKAKLKAKWGSGWLSVSESGDITFTVRPKLSATFIDGAVYSASIKLTDVTVKSIQLDNVPGWMTDNHYVRDFLTSKFQNLPSINLKTQLQQFLAMGGSLGPTVVA